MNNKGTTLVQKDILSTFLSRIKTQDRDSRIPMRVIQKILSKNPVWADIVKEYALSTSFIVSADGSERIALRNLNELSFDESAKKVILVDDQGLSHEVFTEVYDRKNRRGGVYAPLSATAMRELTLDHDFPIACAFDMGRFPTISAVNDSYSDYLSTLAAGDASPSKLASGFMKEKGDSLGVDKDELIDELKKLFDHCPLTVMYSKYNTSKNNNFQYCDRALTCEYSEIKRTMDGLKKKEFLDNINRFFERELRNLRDFEGIPDLSDHPFSNPDPYLCIVDGQDCEKMAEYSKQWAHDKGFEVFVVTPDGHELGAPILVPHSMAFQADELAIEQLSSGKITLLLLKNLDKFDDADFQALRAFVSSKPVLINENGERIKLKNLLILAIMAGGAVFDDRWRYFDLSEMFVFSHSFC